VLPAALFPVTNVNNIDVDAVVSSDRQSGLAQLLADAATAAARESNTISNTPTGAEAFVAAFITSATNSNMLTRFGSSLGTMPQSVPRLVPLAQINAQVAGIVDNKNVNDLSQYPAVSTLRETPGVPLPQSKQTLQERVSAAGESASPAFENRSPVLAGRDSADLAGGNIAATTLAGNDLVATALASELMMPVPATVMNPSLAAAVAAYRVNDAVESTPSYVLSKRASAAVPDISAVMRITPDALDPHEGSSENRQDPAGQKGGKTAAHNTPERITETPSPGSTGLDVIA
jgi:hypothetical protein